MKTESIWQADVQQRVFRELVEAFSRPGDIRNLSAWVDGAGALRAVLATLMDGEATLADPHGQVDVADWPLLQVKSTMPEVARYVVADGRRAPDFAPALGTLDSPEQGATMLLRVEKVGAGETALALEGPGIEGGKNLRIAGLAPAWLERRAEWGGAFPLGVELLLADAVRIVALPRTTRVAVMKGDAR